LIELAAIRRADGRLEFLRILANKIENAAAVEIAALPRLRAQTAVIAEQPFKQGPGIERGRQRLAVASPGEVIGIRTGVAGIAVAAATLPATLTAPPTIDVMP